MAFFMLGVFLAAPQDPIPTELGAVEWHRDFDAARKLSQESGKPMLLLFQEVPG